MTSLNPPSSRRCLLLLAAAIGVAACDDAEDGDENTGDGGSASTTAAPWEMGDLSNAVWVTDPDNDRRDGNAVLILSSNPLDCDTVTEVDDEWEMVQTLGEGNGLMFFFEYDNYQTGGGGDDDVEEEVLDDQAPSPADPGEDWEGLWMGGYGMAADESVQRSMASLAFHDGFVYVLDYYGGGSWLRIDTMTDGAPAGEYNAVYWTGTFAAENCGEWQEYNYGGDTGHWD
jgi:hypothetical protein